MRLNKYLIVVLVILINLSCKKYMDIVPDNVATIDYSFRMRTTAEQYLYTCYSYLPTLGSMNFDPGRFGADEQWLNSQKLNVASQNIGRGLQNINDPYNNYWKGTHSASNLWNAIRDCNIFIERINSVPDMEFEEKKQWEAEVKVLKAYYHFFLLRMYGPIPVVRENLPISIGVEELKIYQEPVDSIFSYIVDLLNEAEPYLPRVVLDRNSELGRITLPIELGLKAKILVYYASPLFNGNENYSDFKNNRGELLFNPEYNEDKWKEAVEACQIAIDNARDLGYELFKFVPGNEIRNISDSTKLKLNYRGVVTERWNSEIIWANTNSTTRDLQKEYAPRALNPSQTAYQVAHGSVGATLNIAKLFYTDKGLPIEEDITWDYNNRYELKEAGEVDKFFIKEGYTTAHFNFNRESRFYGGLGFDGGIWYGNGKYDDNDTYWLEAKLGQYTSNLDPDWHSITGYYVKKLTNYTNTRVDLNTYTTTDYPWVLLRLSDLYLLCAEALNEYYGYNEESLNYLNRIRERAGLPSVQTSWDDYSRHPGKYKSKEGLREIIHRERAIELAFEGERFWDLRRWNEGIEKLNGPIEGWDIKQEEAEDYYRVNTIFNQTFELKDYFWPIDEDEIIVNRNLVQNPGW